ncbi:MAG: MFS transporter [Candidatus Uhrbacteria bacterium]|nr:MFS transporter [Candidatus Uhrbacteria bacterium]
MRSTTTYNIFTVIKGLGFGATATLYVPMLLDYGFSYSQVAMINAIYWTILILAEVPTGMLADGRGRGFSITLGGMFHLVGGLLYSVANTFALAVVSEAFVAIGTAFFSGALSAWIADAPDRTETLAQVYGRETMLRGVGMIIGAFLGVGLAIPFGRSVGFFIFGLLAGIGMLFSWRYMHGNEPEHTMSEFEALGHSYAHLRRSPALRWIVAIQFLAGVFVMFNLYWAPLALIRVNEIGLGFVWMLIYPAMILAGWVVRRASLSRQHEARGVVIAIVVGLVPLMAFSINQPFVLWLAFMVVHEFGRGALAPLIDAYTNERVSSGYRATFSSLRSFVGSGGMVLTLLIASFALSGAQDVNTDLVPSAWRFAGFVVLSLLAVLWFVRPRLKKEE